MALTGKFQELVRQRAERDPAFRTGLLLEAIEALINDDLATSKSMLRTYINATVGFQKLGENLGKHPKSLMRMLSANGNPQAKKLTSIINFLKKHEGIRIEIIESSKHAVHS